MIMVKGGGKFTGNPLDLKSIDNHGRYGVASNHPATDFSLAWFAHRCICEGKPTGDYQPKAGVDITNSGIGNGPYPLGLDWAWHGVRPVLQI
eukprot:1735684-Amphidinium_carterae.2